MTKSKKQKANEAAVEAGSEKEYQDGEDAAERQAAIERNRVLDVLETAEANAARQPTAAAANKTFWQHLRQHFKDLFAGDGMT